LTVLKDYEFNNKIPSTIFVMKNLTLSASLKACLGLGLKFNLEKKRAFAKTQW